ncbi:MAG TPA: hypothetical protein VG405_07355 [Solirubrobacteraceae bacterium]|nr:hypothetical protein [Solirubrobacteraceae bacterium]
MDRELLPTSVRAGALPWGPINHRRSHDLASNPQAECVDDRRIKNGAVTGNKIKDGAVTGNKVQLSSLGTVPSASTADSVTGLGTLRSGQSESGIWGTSGPTSDYAIAELSFHLQLAAPLDSTHTIYVSGASATHCPGAGQADAGYLCVYLGEAHGLTLYAILAPGGGGSSSTFGADKTGATIYFNTSSSEPIYGDGQWTVTAP